MYGFLNKMLGMLTSAYDSSTLGNIGKLFSIFANAFEEVHETALKAKNWRDIDKAHGATLDRWGKNIGVTREGLNDELYRLILKVKIVALLSGGDIETIIWATATILRIDPDKIDFKEIFPAKISMVIPIKSAEPYGSVVLIQRFVKRILAAGVGVEGLRLAFDEHVAFYAGVEYQQARYFTYDATLEMMSDPEVHIDVELGIGINTYREIIV